MNDLMKLPVEVIDQLSSEEMLFIGGGLNPYPLEPNNSNGTCEGANNASGTCNLTNNGSGSCGGTNNKDGSCSGVHNNSNGVCGD